MQAVCHTVRRQPRLRGGFTLIELLVVIVIIGILVALLFPAVTGAIRSTREAQVVAEMANIDKALVEFRNRYGVDVPSFIVLCEAGAHWNSDWNSSPPVAGLNEDYRRESRAFIRQVWPEFDFSYGTAGAVDLNGDGDTTDVLLLNGTECLVFFLGGVFQRGTSASNLADDTLIGFSANPQYPFDASSTGNRVGPFYEFAPTRYMRDGGVPVDFDNDGMPEYVDPLPGQTRPYVYVSSYGGRGYRINGINGTAGDLDDEIEPQLGLNDAYRKDDGNTATLGPYLNPNTYQLISPGADGEFGVGGEYNGEAVPAARANERDNITNFKGGRLN